MAAAMPGYPMSPGSMTLMGRGAWIRTMTSRSRDFIWIRDMRWRRHSRICECKREGAGIQLIHFFLVSLGAHPLEQTHHETLAILLAGTIAVLEFLDVNVMS